MYGPDDIVNTIFCGNSYEILKQFLSESIRQKSCLYKIILTTNTTYRGMSDTIMLAYLAGFIDGEGSIMIRRNYYRVRNPKHRDCKNPLYSARLGVKNTCEKPLLILKEMFGGNLMKDKKTYPSVSGYKPNKPLYVYDAEYNIAISILEALLPYLIIKKPQAQLVLQLKELKLKATKDRYKIGGGWQGKPYKQEYIAKFEELYNAVKTLNGNPPKNTTEVTV